MSRRRRAVLGAAALLAGSAGLAACNLRPLYGGADGGALATELAAIEVTTGAYELGYIVRTEVVKLLNPRGIVAARRYDLQVDVEETRSGLSIQLDSTVTRFDLYLLASYALRRRGEIEPAFTGAATRVASYNVVRQPYAQISAEIDARRRAAIEVARDIRARLALFLTATAP